MVLSGGGWMDIDGTPHTLQPGGILLAPSNLPHRAHSGPDGLTRPLAAGAARLGAAPASGAHDRAEASM